MNKIDKLDKELEKAREKAAEWQGQNPGLGQQKKEGENNQNVQGGRTPQVAPPPATGCLA